MTIQIGKAKKELDAMDQIEIFPRQIIEVSPKLPEGELATPILFTGVGASDVHRYVQLTPGSAFVLTTTKDDPLTVGSIYAKSDKTICVVEWEKRGRGRSPYKRLGISVKNITA